MMTYQCDRCGEENFIEIPIDECDAEFDVTVLDGNIKLTRFENHVQLTIADWEKVAQIWKSYYTELRRQ